MISQYKTVHIMAKDWLELYFGAIYCLSFCL